MHLTAPVHDEEDRVISYYLVVHRYCLCLVVLCDAAYFPLTAAAKLSLEG